MAADRRDGYSFWKALAASFIGTTASYAIFYYMTSRSLDKKAVMFFEELMRRYGDYDHRGRRDKDI